MLKSIISITEYTFKTVRKFFIFSFILLLLILEFSCGSAKIRHLEKTINLSFNADVFSNHHAGFMIYDPISKDTLLRKSANRYYIPASNVKIFTLYTCLSLIPKKVPVLKYSIEGDTLYFEGQGDPAGLHPYFKDTTAIEFLSNYNYLRYHPNNIASTHFGTGWAWDDYDQPFAASRSSFPLYGNVVSIYPNSIEEVYPDYFKDSISFNEMEFRRSENGNIFNVPPGHSDTVLIPLDISPELTTRLLRDRLAKDVNIADKMPEADSEILFGFSRDSILKRMMVESDNFLAEQLLLVASGRLSDTLMSKTSITQMMETALADLNPPPRWVDGSGLSRYNLFTPEAMVHVLNRIYQEYGQNEVLLFFPVGGVSGTIEDDFRGDPNPYIFAKSGSLGNIYCLSGYLRSQSGRLLIFSFMNNHFTTGRDQLKEKMAAMLEFVRDNY